MNITIKPIAYVFNRREKIEDDFWGDVISEIKLVDELPAECFDGIETFSHIEIIFYFNKSAGVEKFIYKAHPRENPEWDSVGIFAQRKRLRPNLIGSTITELLRRDGKSIYVRKLDALNGTPVIDIKPMYKEFLPAGKIIQPTWVSELAKNYWSK